jgi:hypothetical protein
MKESQVTIKIEKKKKLWHFVAKTRFASETAVCHRKRIVARHNGIFLSNCSDLL